MEDSAFSIGLITLVLFGALFAGGVGTKIGSTVNKAGNGFLLGLFLGPIGWIIVLLLPRQENGNKQEESVIRINRPEQNLDNDDYKIWLGKTYNIKRNELFEQFECENKLFSTLEEALVFADEKETERGNLTQENLDSENLAFHKSKEDTEYQNLAVILISVSLFFFILLVFTLLY